jgi:ArsR family transcriptional regulator, arsenate/arsenite/antimonite-responsive transcriptional repressor
VDSARGVHHFSCRIFDDWGTMELGHAVTSFAALGHETRLQIVRHLVQEGPNGLSAGAISERLEVVASTLSFHLKELERAGLLTSWRRQRQIFYAADFEGLRRLLTFLTDDCCGGRPEICGGLLQAVAGCGGTGPKGGKQR